MNRPSIQAHDIDKNIAVNVAGILSE